METDNIPYWIIDVLPKQVPADSPGRYFTVEKYFLAHLDELCRRFARILIKLNCYRDLQVSKDKEQWTAYFSPEDLEAFFRESADTHSPLFIRIHPSDALLTFTGDDHYMTLYAPDEELLNLLRPIAASEGLTAYPVPETTHAQRNGKSEEYLEPEVNKAMNSKQLARIRKMEDDFNRVQEVIQSLDNALADYEAVRLRIKRLADYQESGQWLKDFEADERGELPKYQELRRGVLSEDGLDNLLRDVADIRARMQELLEEPDSLDDVINP